MQSASQERTGVFISYSHKDQDWLDRVLVHLRPLEREHAIEIWSDRKILSGSRWRQEIEAALQRAKVAILLISADFLASDFIAEKEPPPLLEAAENEGTIILCVIVSPSRFTRTRLANFQAVNDPYKPLVELTIGERERVLVDLSYRLESEFIAKDNVETDTNQTLRATSTSYPLGMEGWQTYFNWRFGFLVRFPKDWVKGEESDNGDGCQLRIGDPDNRISAWAGWYNEYSSPFENILKPEFTHSRLKLANGKTGSLIVGRIGEQSLRKILFQLVEVESGVHYHLHAEVTEEFFNQNRDILLKVARSFEIHRDRAIDRVAIIRK